MPGLPPLPPEQARLGKGSDRTYTTRGEGGVPPPDPPPQTKVTIAGKNRNLQSGKCRAIFGTQTFGSQTLPPPPPPLLPLPWAGGGSDQGLRGPFTRCCIPRPHKSHGALGRPAGPPAADCPMRSPTQRVCSPQPQSIWSPQPQLSSCPCAPAFPPTLSGPAPFQSLDGAGVLGLRVCRPCHRRWPGSRQSLGLGPGGARQLRHWISGGLFSEPSNLDRAFDLRYRTLYLF